MIQMTGYLIDPRTATIVAEPYDGDYRTIQRLIGGELGPRPFDVATFNEAGDGVYVDDEGLFGAENFFIFPGLPNALAGRGYVLGVDKQGNSITPSVSLTWLRSNTRFFMR